MSSLPIGLQEFDCQLRVIMWKGTVWKRTFYFIFYFSCFVGVELRLGFEVLFVLHWGVGKLNKCSNFEIFSFFCLSKCCVNTQTLQSQIVCPHANIHTHTQDFSFKNLVFANIQYKHTHLSDTVCGRNCHSDKPQNWTEIFFLLLKKSYLVV